VAFNNGFALERFFFLLSNILFERASPSRPHTARGYICLYTHTHIYIYIYIYICLLFFFEPSGGRALEQGGVPSRSDYRRLYINKYIPCFHPSGRRALEQGGVSGGADNRRPRRFSRHVGPR